MERINEGMRRAGFTLTIVFAIGFGLSAAPASNEITLAVADRSNTTPWVAAAGRFVAAVWGAAAAGKADVMIAVSRDGGQ